MRRFEIIIIVLLLALFVQPLTAGELVRGCQTEISADEKSQKIINVNLAGVGIITAWGVRKWDYFSRSMHAQSEGWFQNDTESGGADKLGHLYTSYVAAHGLSALFENGCFNKKEAALYGALSSFAITGYMEFGDSFSNYGFSHEDLIVNALGSVFGYYLYRDPELANKLDLRWEYGFDPQGNDFTTDYENSKYLFALKLNGFDTFRNSFLKHFELHLGYYTRGFFDPLVTKQRNVFVGIGLNLTDLFRRQGYKKTATFLNYYQVPGTNMEFERDFNK